MAIDILMLIAGLALAAMTLRDVFQTVVVPGGSRASLRVAPHLIQLLLPAWKWARGRRRGLSATFAPLLLVLSFAVWLLLLLLGFGLAAWALRGEFQPRLRDFGDAVFAVGESLTTIGAGSGAPFGYARWLILLAGFCGLAVITMAVTYLLMVQGSIGRRDTGIMKLNSTAGTPPSAVGLLRTLADIHDQSRLQALLEQARDWCVTVRQSHSSHPSLIYFQSVGTGSGWPAMLGALLDFALIGSTIIDDPKLYGGAVLLGQDGVRMAHDLAELSGLRPKEKPSSPAELRELARLLSECGYNVRPNLDFDDIARRRSEAQACVNALADHLGKPSTQIIPA